MSSVSLLDSHKLPWAGGRWDRKSDLWDKPHFSNEVVERLCKYLQCILRCLYYPKGANTELVIKKIITSRLKHYSSRSSA